jgi:hypothetical protein
LAFDLVYLPKYFQIFNYFISQDITATFRTIGPSAKSHTLAEFGGALWSLNSAKSSHRVEIVS